ncbi:hypothetical protein J6590_000106 [Homalodisca vitripennis]|nr:hypothetical protein J6590_000106 [Homalodisca vitripennis]
MEVITGHNTNTINYIKRIEKASETRGGRNLSLLSERLSVLLIPVDGGVRGEGVDHKPRFDDGGRGREDNVSSVRSGRAGGLAEGAGVSCKGGFIYPTTSSPCGALLNHSQSSPSK